MLQELLINIDSFVKPRHQIEESQAGGMKMNWAHLNFL